MDNASKNANEMISKLQMQFNRQRQAVITNELVDIIVRDSASAWPTANRRADRLSPCLGQTGASAL